MPQQPGNRARLVSGSNRFVIGDGQPCAPDLKWPTARQRLVRGDDESLLNQRQRKSTMGRPLKATNAMTKKAEKWLPFDFPNGSVWKENVNKCVR